LSTITASPRPIGNLKTTELLIAQGILPIALWERGRGAWLLQAPMREVMRAFKEKKGCPLLDVVVDGEKKPRRTVVTRLDRDDSGKVAEFMQLQEVADTDRVVVQVPVVVSSYPKPGSLKHAAVETPKKKVKIKAAVKDVPEEIEVDASKLKLGDELRAKDVRLPKGVRLATKGEEVLAKVRPDF